MRLLYVFDTENGVYTFSTYIQPIDLSDQEATWTAIQQNKPQDMSLDDLHEAFFVTGGMKVVLGKDVPNPCTGHNPHCDGCNGPKK